jgi:hypothetical protein
MNCEGDLFTPPATSTLPPKPKDRDEEGFDLGPVGGSGRRRADRPLRGARLSRYEQEIHLDVASYFGTDHDFCSTLQTRPREKRGAKRMSAATQRGVDLGLNDDEIAFYDALAANDSAVEAMGKDELKVIAAELVTQVRKSATIDWTLRESARAKIKVLVKRILRKHGYPPDLEEEATKTVLAQAELLCAEWAEA